MGILPNVDPPRRTPCQRCGAAESLTRRIANRYVSIRSHVMDTTKSSWGLELGCTACLRLANRWSRGSAGVEFGVAPRRTPCQLGPFGAAGLRRRCGAAEFTLQHVIRRANGAVLFF